MTVALGMFLFWLFLEYLECKPIYDSIKRNQKKYDEEEKQNIIKEEKEKIKQYILQKEMEELKNNKKSYYIKF